MECIQMSEYVHREVVKEGQPGIELDSSVFHPGGPIAYSQYNHTCQQNKKFSKLLEFKSFTYHVMGEWHTEGEMGRDGGEGRGWGC